jgi:acyl carrier protein phosphodiesterase
MERDSLILYAKIEALFFQVYPTFKNYPKAEKHGLCLQIKQCFIDLLWKVALASWYSYAGNASCQRFVREACQRTRRIRFTSNERFHVRMT